MEDIAQTSIVQKLSLNSPNKIYLSILIASLVMGAVTGYLLSSNRASTADVPVVVNDTPKHAEQDKKTFRDFAEGTIQKRPESKNSQEYIEGTHILLRQGAVSVALTSSVVDLSEFEGKKVVVYGETQKAIKEGWLMDVGRVEEK